MRLEFTLRDAETGITTDVELSAAAETPMTEVIGVLAERQPAPGDLFLEGRELAAAPTLGSSSLRDGAIVDIGRPVETHVGPDDAIQVRVIAGPAAGSTFTLVPDRPVTVGRGRNCDIQVDDPELSRRHMAILDRDSDGIFVRDLDSHNGTWCEADRLGDVWLRVDSDAWLRAGSTLLTISASNVPDGRIRVDAENRIAFNRPPRSAIMPAEPTTITIPKRPSTPDRRPFPVIALVAPVVLAVVFVALGRRPEFMLFVLLSPIMLAGHWLNDRRMNRRRAHGDAADHTRRQQRALERLDATLIGQRDARRRALPDVVTVLSAAAGPTRHLWERRTGDGDSIELCVGIGDAAADISLRTHDPDADSEIATPDLHLVPIGVDLREAGVLGIAGPRPAVLARLNWLLAQLAVLHSPDDVAIALLTTRDDAETGFGWTRWLPHMRGPARGATRRIATDITAGATLVDELVGLIETRTLAESSAAAVFGSIVVIVDDASRMRTLPNLERVLADGPGVGIYAICLDSDRNLLPSECRATLYEDDGADVHVETASGTPANALLSVELARCRAERVARRLAPVYLTGERTSAALPSSARLLEVLEIENPDGASIRRLWEWPTPATEAVLGVGARGPCKVDLAGDGPHTLVAGTTGAGKSELLKTLIASLAARVSPTDCNFVILDFKGGADLQLCARLPHCVGFATNLDQPLARRAVGALDAELRRRQALCARAGVQNITSYTAKRATDPELAPLPRLVVVIDEFARLKDDLDDFMAELKGLFREGRAYGIHIVLCTQLVTGVVSHHITGNTSLRIALRLEDATDSRDVIDTGDAASIPKSSAGRAFVRASGRFDQFQAARIGGPRPSTQTGDDVVARSFSWPVDPARPAETSEAGDVPDTETELHDLVRAIRAAAETGGHEPVRRLLLPPLPESVTLDDLDEVVPDETAPGTVPFALEDVPEENVQATRFLRVDAGEHLGVAGSSGTGRTSALRTIAAALAVSTTPAAVRIFGFDFTASAGLRAVEALPACAGVADADDPTELEDILTDLEDEITRRRRLLRERHVASVRDLSAHEDTALPYLVVLVDGLERLERGDQTRRRIAAIAAAAKAGVFVAAAGDRQLLSSGDIGDRFKHRLLLRFNDPNDYLYCGLTKRRSIPACDAPGRAVDCTTGRECQIALLDADTSSTAQDAALRELGARLTPRQGRPAPIPRPPNVGVGPPAGAELPILVGEDPRRGRRIWSDLDTESPFVVSGPAGSGRSTLLSSFVQTLVEHDTPVLLLVPDETSPLRDLAVQHRATALVGDAARDPDLAQAWKPGTAIVVDDAHLIRPANRHLRALIETGAGGPPVAIAMNPRDVTPAGWVAMLERELRTGVVLWPSRPRDGRCLGIDLDGRTFEAADTTAPGRGWFHRDNHLDRVETPWLDSASRRHAG